MEQETGKSPKTAYKLIVPNAVQLVTFNSMS
jgi:hypothetical protein